ncbi:MULTISPECIES: hypothetical protein [Rhizobium]|jgi:hypothetical protein|uniref:Uncharacterized protein n=1 Tax=Rhizobium lusitanum TaxID=293958 RepID=A0A1C3V2F0_9HYPH|nr:hypothetical protein [Rhizobium lusitanum]SCB21834.1 hypothetical protein GA0061101_10488 [Rhizobium lusitanum]
MAEHMAGPMSAERFAEMVDAYGGDIGRWPQDERAAARAHARSAEAAGMLERAADLDSLLDTYVLKAGHEGLDGRIVAKFVHRSRMRNLFRFGSAGIGLVGIGIAGALAGSIAIAILAPSLTSDTVIASDGTATMFGDVGPDAAIRQDSQ